MGLGKACEISARDLTKSGVAQFCVFKVSMPFTIQQPRNQKHMQEMRDRQGWRAQKMDAQSCPHHYPIVAGRLHQQILQGAIRAIRWSCWQMPPHWKNNLKGILTQMESTLYQFSIFMWYSNDLDESVVLTYERMILMMWTCLWIMKERNRYDFKKSLKNTCIWRLYLTNLLQI